MTDTLTPFEANLFRIFGFVKSLFQKLRDRSFSNDVGDRSIIPSLNRLNFSSFRELGWEELDSELM